MVLLIDTTREHAGAQIKKELLQNGRNPGGVELIDTTGMQISHCVGCNYCWLKTPGICSIKDDYEPVLKKISKADQVWLITDTKFGFVTYQTKNIIDRVLPLMTMNIHIVGKQMRHIPRYDSQPDWGIIYTGDGDKEYLSLWCERTALNFGRKSLGVFEYRDYKEAVRCMQ